MWKVTLFLSNHLLELRLKMGRAGNTLHVFLGHEKRQLYLYMQSESLFLEKKTDWVWARKCAEENIWPRKGKIMRNLRMTTYWWGLSTPVSSKGNWDVGNHDHEIDVTFSFAQIHEICVEIIAWKNSLLDMQRHTEQGNIKRSSGKCWVLDSDDLWFVQEREVLMKSEEDIWVLQNTINIGCLEVFQDVGRGAIKKHKVRICDSIVLELTVFHQLDINFSPTLYICIYHSFSKIFPMQDHNINR